MDQSTAAQKTSNESWREELIQPKQKAVLEFLKMPVPPTRGGASNLIKAVFESPAGNAHQNLWNASKYELHPDLYPEPAKKALPAPEPPTLLGLIVKMLLAVAVLFYFTDLYIEYSPLANSTPAGDSPSATTPGPAATPAVPPAKSAAAPELKPGSDLLSLESTDGRTVQAKVLAPTKTTVLIRREDGQTFDLPLDQLTDDSKRRIEEYRAVKRSGAVK